MSSNVRSISGAKHPSAPGRTRGLGVLVGLLSALALSGCASVAGGSPAPGSRAAAVAEGASGAELAALARFEAVAGDAVPHFRLLQVSGYTAFGERHLAVWTRAHQAWLLTVEGPCTRLPWATGLGITSSLGRVHARFDRVLVDGERCRILTIRPVDVEALREGERRPPGAISKAVAQSPGGT